MTTAEPFMPADHDRSDPRDERTENADSLKADSGAVDEPTEETPDETVEQDPADGAADTPFRTPEPGDRLTAEGLSERSSGSGAD